MISTRCCAFFAVALLVLSCACAPVAPVPGDNQPLATPTLDSVPLATPTLDSTGLAAPTPDPGAAAAGSLGILNGSVGYDAFPSPASVLYVINTADPQVYYSLDLPASSGLIPFSLQVPPGTYQLIAYAQDGSAAAAIHSLEADISAVTVAAGQTTGDLLVHQFAPELPCQTVAVPASPDGRFPTVEAAPGCAGTSAQGGQGVATPAGGVPTKPGSLNYEYTCSAGSATTNFAWIDSSNNEEGFRLYRDGNLLTVVGANTTYFQDIITAPSGVTITYRLTAFNAAGESDYRTAVVSCP